MDIKTLEDDPLILEWFESMEYKPYSRRNHLYGMKEYTAFTDKTPSELLEEAEDEIKQGLLMRQRNIKKYLIQFRKSLNERELAPKTVKSYVGSAKAFYKAFDVDLPNINRNSKKVVVLEKNKPIPSRDDITDVLVHTDIRSRALILLQTSSGLGANELLNLTIKTF
ncbi:hypothetical protein [Methanococcoides sp. AM1]|uniref:hypothetical protein n=1 Tax=Methanococcoides sp. AM1 TaxID=1201011 RepID=UPI001083BD1E|nr:hypothetical protein [Methanococcoides sp. AM1]